MSYTVTEFFYHFVDSGPQIPKIPKIPKISMQPKRNQKNQDTSITLNNVLLSFQKGTPIRYDHNNLFTP